MERAKLNFLEDVALIVSFLIVFISGVLKFPPAIQALRSTIPYSAVTPLHDFSGILLGILVIVHIILHWNWIVSMTKSFLKR